MTRQHPTIKALSVRRRHPHGASSDNLRQERQMKRDIVKLIEQYQINKNNMSEYQKGKFKRLILIRIKVYFAITEIPPELEHESRLMANGNTRRFYFDKLSRIEKVNLRIDMLNDNDVAQYFRFRSKADLRLLFQHFRFEEWYRTSKGHRFHGDEVFLAGLYRLHAPMVFGEAGWRLLFGFSYSRASKCFEIFRKFMDPIALAHSGR